jgi:DNA-binding response OmpR family regulator
MARSITTHETLLVTSCDEATELFEDLDVLPELILCDVALPDGLGTELHQQAEPQLAERFVFVTGGVVGKDATDYLKSCGRPTLIKPITIDEVHQLIGATSTPPGDEPPNPAPPPRERAPSLADVLELEDEVVSQDPEDDLGLDW